VFAFVDVLDGELVEEEMVVVGSCEHWTGSNVLELGWV